MALATSKGSFVWKRVEASCDSFGLTLLTRSVYAFSRERKQTKQGQDSKDEEKIEGRQKLKDERKRKRRMASVRPSEVAKREGTCLLQEMNI